MHLKYFHEYLYGCLLLLDEIRLKQLSVNFHVFKIVACIKCTIKEMHYRFEITVEAKVQQLHHLHVRRALHYLLDDGAWNVFSTPCLQV